MIESYECFVRGGELVMRRVDIDPEDLRGKTLFRPVSRDDGGASFEVVPAEDIERRVRAASEGGP